MLIDRTSLATTIDSLIESEFYGEKPSRLLRHQTVRWLLSRHKQPGAYANTFAPTERDLERGMRLFCGQKITQKNTIGHVLSEEACRAVLKLGTNSKAERQAFEQAQQCLVRHLDQNGTGQAPYGVDTCATSTVALWRHLAAGGLDQQTTRLKHGLTTLKDHRDPATGRWRTFPFYYTVLTLLEINLPEATEELHYINPALQAAVTRNTRSPYDKRRRDLAQRTLIKVQASLTSDQDP